MTKKTFVYLAGAMDSVGGNYNFPLFDFCAEKLRAAGCEVYSPAEHARKHIGSLEDIQKMDKKEFKIRLNGLLKEEILWIIDHANVVFLLPGWESSLGARAEKALAEKLGIRTIEAPDVILLDEYVKSHFDVADFVEPE